MDTNEAVLIENIEIKYFRSIYHLRLTSLKDVNVLSGKNDIGKSNILKAFNLFFNNETDWNSEFDFQIDLSSKRLQEVRKETIKGRQFVQIKIDFLRGNRFQKSLPKKFSVTKTWFRYGQAPEVKSSLPYQFKSGQLPGKTLEVAQRSLQRFLNRIKFQYIPAVKDINFYNYILGVLQDVIFERRKGESVIADAINDLNTKVKKEALSLCREFYNASGVNADIKLPEKLDELFRAFSVMTKSDVEAMPLKFRGDGIQARFIPSLLNFVSKNSKYIYIWGFEEPENCLELSLCNELAQKLVSAYSRNAQVFLTSHSPAFFTMRSENMTVFRVYYLNGTTSCALIYPGQVSNKIAELEKLEAEIGLMEFQQKWMDDYRLKLKNLEDEEEIVKRLKIDLSRSNAPLILTEGKWDKSILITAWNNLYPDKNCQYEIMSCNPDSSISETNGGGVPKLLSYLNAHRADERITIGLFDRDRAGKINGFDKLNNSFRNIDEADYIKIADNGSAGAILLPVIDSRREYAEVLNYPIEFYFDDEYLDKKINDEGLILRPRKVRKTVVGLNSAFAEENTDEPHFREIDKSTKKAFVEIILPQLPPAAFENFRILFNSFDIALAKMRQIRSVNGRQDPS